MNIKKNYYAMVLTAVLGPLQAMTKVIARSAKQRSTMNFPILINCLRDSSIKYVEMFEKVGKYF